MHKLKLALIEATSEFTGADQNDRQLSIIHGTRARWQFDYGDSKAVKAKEGTW